MRKKSKRLYSLIFLKKKVIYSFQEATILLKEFQSLKFLESVEAHIALNINPKYTNQQLRTNLILPHGTGKSLRIAIFTDSEDIEQIQDMGVNILNSNDLLEKINSEDINFDVLITTPEYISKLTRYGKILGPKALMPSIKTGTVTTNLKETILDIKKGRIEYRADKTGVVHIRFGNTEFSAKELENNLIAIYESIEKNKPLGVKGKYVKSFYVCTTMSPSIKLDTTSFK